MNLKERIKSLIYKKNINKYGLITMGHHVSKIKENLPDENSIYEGDLESFIIRNKNKFSSIKNMGKGKIVLTFDDGFEDLYSVVFPMCVKYNIPFAGFISAGLLNTDGYLKDEEIITMIESGLFTLCSHGMTHAILTSICDKQLITESHESKKVFEDKFGKKINFFAYSHGQFDKKVKRLVKKAGYTYAFTASEIQLFTSLLTIPRMNLTLLIGKEGSSL